MDAVTPAGTVTFAVADDERAAAVAGLESIGFTFGRPETVAWSLLDSFDGRLHAAGLRLQASHGSRLELSGAASVSATIAVSSIPRVVRDLPPGPFRARLARLVEVRALLPVMSSTVARTRATLQDALGKTVAIADLFERLWVEGHGAVAEPSSTVEITEVTGYAKRARATVAALEQLGLRRIHTDTVAAMAAASGVNLAGRTDAPTVPLDPQMPAIDGFRAVLANLADTIAANWQGTIDEIDPEFLHDLRVAVRRSRSVLSQGKKVLPPTIVAPAIERLAQLGALTSRARDLDVYLIEWDGYVRPLGSSVIAAVQPVHTVLQHRCRVAHASLVEGMQSRQATDLMATWQAWLGEAQSDQPGPNAPRPVGPFVAGRIAKAHSRLVERGRLIGPSSPPQQIHDLRKDAKKLRYLLECFGSLLADKPRRSFVRRLKAFQDNLGEFQDSEVHADELADIAAELHAGNASSETMLAIGQLIGLFEQRRAAARVEFAERFATFDSKATRRTLDEALAAIER